MVLTGTSTALLDSLHLELPCLDSPIDSTLSPAEELDDQKGQIAVMHGQGVQISEPGAQQVEEAKTISSAETPALSAAELPGRMPERTDGDDSGDIDSDQTATPRQATLRVQSHQHTVHQSFQLRSRKQPGVRLADGAQAASFESSAQRHGHLDFFEMAGKYDRSRGRADVGFRTESGSRFRVGMQQPFADRWCTVGDELLSAAAAGDLKVVRNKAIQLNYHVNYANKVRQPCIVCLVPDFHRFAHHLLLCSVGTLR